MYTREEVLSKSSVFCRFISLLIDRLNVYPSLDKGEFIQVWYRGEWKKDGPWVKQIESLIDDLIIRLEQVKEDRAVKAEAEKKEQNRLREIKANNLVTEWENKNV